MPRLFHDSLYQSGSPRPEAPALRLKQQTLSYAELTSEVDFRAAWLMSLGLEVGARVAIYLPKQFETVTSFYACSRAGGVFVPVNPLLKGPQVSYLLNDCDVSILITSLSRYRQMQSHFEQLEDLKTVILTDCGSEQIPEGCVAWTAAARAQQPTQTARSFPKRISHDMAAILYTSGSTGAPKGVVLSHKNLISGAKSVAEYLHNHPEDRLLAVLPFSFDYGLSQITTAFISGASLILMEYLFPKDVVQAVNDYQITGLAAVPPLWIQLAELDWPSDAQASLRYITNSGGAMPTSTLDQLRSKLPTTLPYLMYGLTEAFRSTYLEPEQIEQRPTSMGKAIPDAEILVINANGQIAAPGEEGELVHRGPHVALGYWNAREKTQARFKPLPEAINSGLTPELAVWSGDTVIRDEDGYFYFVGRKDDMIKSSGYRISPAEIEECLFQHDSIAEAVALGAPHEQLGEAIIAVVKINANADINETQLVNYCRKQLPNFMQPKKFALVDSIPRNANGKIDRAHLRQQFCKTFIHSKEAASEASK